MFVPSLSWQNDHFYIKSAQKLPFSHRATNLLAELRGNPLAMHAELLWATCAAMSANSNKVLEPFPSFLLKKQQMRARAGQFAARGRGVG